MGFNDILKDSFVNIWNTQQNIPETTMLYTFSAVFILSFYILIVYRQTTKTSFYSVNFAKTLVGVPLITTAIVFAMQVNILVSLGMVGALSIIRFRNAIKDPLDLLFLFWSISVGIVCGTGSFLIAIFLSIIMTIMLFLIDFVPNKVDSMLLVINANSNVSDDEILEIVTRNTKYNKVRTRVLKKESKDFLIEIKIQNESDLMNQLSEIEGMNKITILSHDGEVRL